MAKMMSPMDRFFTWAAKKDDFYAGYYCGMFISGLVGSVLHGLAVWRLY